MGGKKIPFEFSELIRLEICQAVISYICERYPEYKSGYSMKDFLKNVSNFEKGKIKPDDLDRIISTIYFEARKAIEYRFTKEKITEK